jgi:hypothetical protein
VQDVPRLDFNVSNAAADLATSQEARLRRARAMAPVLLGDRLIPVLPLANPFTIPATGSSCISHHGIVLHIAISRARCCFSSVILICTSPAFVAQW